MRISALLLAAALVGCGGTAVVGPEVDSHDGGATPADASTDAGSLDAGADDGGAWDAGEPDAGLDDAGLGDAGWDDGGLDAGSLDDGGIDGGVDDGGALDAGAADAGALDAGVDDAGTPDAGTPPPVRTTALLRPANPMPCADPAVVSQGDAGQVFFVYCTSMSHVWKTSDWVHFSDVRGSVTFDLTGMSANGTKMGAWWAPGIVYSPALQEYVMWVSVPDAQATNDPSAGWTMRSLAVLTASAPTGPWTFQAIALNASAAGQHYIDPFLFIDHDGGRYVYWKQYGGGVSSSIMGAKVNAAWTALVAGTSMEVMNGYGGTGTWEDNVRENPAVWYDPALNLHHLIFSGGHWYNDTYATGHAVSSCGPLCPSSQSGGWHMRDSGDRGILQVVQSVGSADFANGGPGGAVFLGDGASIVYAAAALSAKGSATRYLMLDDLKWKNRSPYVDTDGHLPLGF